MKSAWAVRVRNRRPTAKNGGERRFAVGDQIAECIVSEYGLIDHVAACGLIVVVTACRMPQNSYDPASPLLLPCGEGICLLIGSTQRCAG